MKTVFEKITKENFPNLAKEIDFQEVQEAQRVPKKLDPRRNTPATEDHGNQRDILKTNHKIADINTEKMARVKL